MRHVCGGVLILWWSMAAATSARADDQADGRAVLDQAIKAMGGAKKLAALKTGTGKAKITIQKGGDSGTVTVDASWQGLTQYRIEGDAEFNGQSHKGTIVVNGNKGWIQDDNQSKAIPEIVPFIKNLFYAARLPQLLPMLKGKDFTLSPLGELKIDGRAALGLRVNHKGFKDVSLFFDKKTHLPVKSEVQEKEPEGSKEVTVTFVYSEYKDFDGVQHPTKVRIKVDEQDLTMEVSEVHAEEKLEDNLFDKP
jgi:outer membrane lipoprotein-sorting protein